MMRLVVILGVAMVFVFPWIDSPAAEEQKLEVGFAEVEITPSLGTKPVYMAGFGHNRIAQGIHDPLFARVIVLRHGRTKLALVAVDLIGLFNNEVCKVRAKVPGFTGIVVSCTHNHEGPDTMGLWGAGPFQSGLDADYQDYLRKQIVAAIQQAEGRCVPVKARLGTVDAPELLHDTRRPLVKHDELVALEFVEDNEKAKRVGVVVQWNCHPETLESNNKQISADFVGYTVKALKERLACPVVYLTGTVGGLMTTMHLEVKDDKGQVLQAGTYEKTERYGQLLADAATKALTKGNPIQLMPIQVHQRDLFLPVDNKLYQLARQLGVLNREVYLWKGDPDKAELAVKPEPGQALCVRTEVGRLRLGDLEVAAIPGEIYPELVLDKVTDPAEKEADFPDAPIEPAIYKQLRGPHRMLIGLANDEIGYIIPKRQWDEKPPYCYGEKKPPYGEINSLGPNTAPLLCKAFQALLQKK